MKEHGFLWVEVASDLHGKRGCHNVMSDLDSRKQIASIMAFDDAEFKAVLDASKYFDGDGESLAFFIYAFGIWRAKRKSK